MRTFGDKMKKLILILLFISTISFGQSDPLIDGLFANIQGNLFDVNRLSFLTSDNLTLSVLSGRTTLTQTGAQVQTILDGNFNGLIVQSASATDTALYIYNDNASGITRVIIRAGLGNDNTNTPFEILDQDSSLSIRMRANGYIGATQFASIDDTSFVLNSFDDAFSKPGVDLNRSGWIVWSDEANWWGTKDVGIKRNGAGILEINSSVAGTFRDLILRNITAIGLAGLCLRSRNSAIASLLLASQTR